MTRRATRRATRLSTALGALLLLAACTGGEDEAAAPPPKHPVFDGELRSQVSLALRRTQQAGNASFTHTLTFESKRGRAVQTISGRVDFAGGTGEATIRWRVPESYPSDVKDLLLGRAPGLGPADSASHAFVDSRQITYRASSSRYWLRYGKGDYDPALGDGALIRLWGTESPVGGTLMEGLSGTRAVSVSGGNAGRTYRAEMPPVVSSMLPYSLAGELNDEAGAAFNPVKPPKPLPTTVTVDGRGMITHARADLSHLLGKEGSVLDDVTALRMELTLSGIGTSRPVGRAEGTILPASDTVRSIWKVKPGRCVDFSTGQHNATLVAEIPCSRSHDGRLLAQVPYGDGPYPGATATKNQARDACRGAYRRASGEWTGEAAEKGTYWYMWPDREDWRDGGRVVCYVVTPKGAAPDPATAGAL
ncbi:septum formation family protein [Streptomyces griseus]|uniref:septum formation family protein n=1 Tax=Streptomyces griseus TaxID=1911 RepID=UPI0004C9A0F0|nr:septum formation family protein [Streptomyces griseus]